MGSKRVRSLAIVFSATAVAVVVGAGAYAFGSVGATAQRDRAVTGAGATGENAAPGPTASPTRSATSPAAPKQTAAPQSTAPDPATAPPVPAECQGGERQREVEGALAKIDEYGAVTVDGVQTAADCALIKKFQARYGVSPAKGVAGPTTANVARRIATSMSAEEQAKCAAGGPALTICVDLTQQTAWAVRDGAVVWGPTVIRTGMAGGYQTPTGTYRIFGRAKREWSVPYKVWLPYWQAFNGGIGFHETTTYLHDSFGSHGCVNLLHSDAVSLWNLSTVGTTVKVFGRRPGT
jgi:lipoprotein-anchoring transpeptidase ErfK/SrfK